MEGFVKGISNSSLTDANVLHSAHSRRYRVNYLVFISSLEDILGYISGIRHEDRAEMDQVFMTLPLAPVSYTHLTLPTSDLV